MALRGRNLYLILSTACAAGYIWLYYHLASAGTGTFSVCMIKHATGIPCPSCGSTRAVAELVKGHWHEALLINPLSILIAAVLITVPVWILTDLLTGSRSLYRSYHGMEAQLRKPAYAIPLIALVMINWIWNICKGL